MTKRLLTLIALFIGMINIAQTNGFNYKALITDNGNALNTQSVDIRFTILQNGTTAVYQEMQTTTTDTNGILSVSIGEGTVQSGTFSTIDWGADTYFLKVEINRGTGYTDFGTTEFKAVPYAKYADKAGNTFSGDFGDLTGVPADLSDGDDNTQLTETQVDNYVANNGYLTSEVDGSTTNELQTLSFDNGTRELTIANGNTVTIPAGSSSSGDGWGTQIAVTSSSINGDGTSGSPLGVNTNDTAFNGWDKNASDDFDGDFAHLTNVPANLDTDSTDDVTQLNDLSDAKREDTAYYIGEGAGHAVNHDDRYNVGFGYQALYNSTTADYSTAVGYKALYSNTGSSYNTAIGSQTLSENISGNNNTACGANSLQFNTTGIGNSTNGSETLNLNTTGSYNIANGYNALNSNITGNNNVAIGEGALYRSSDKSNLVAVGKRALYNNGGNGTYSNEGVYNTAIGSDALFANTIGSLNTATGNEALKYNTTGSSNTANGVQALYNNSTGSANTANGAFVLHSNSSGNYNTALGCSALHNNSIGSKNIANGYYSLYSNTSGDDNTAIGSSALYSNTEGNNNVAIGNNSLFNNTEGVKNVANGSEALYSNTTGESNCATGQVSMYSNTEGSDNTSNGYYSLYSNTTGSYNTAIGVFSLYHNTTGDDNVAIGNSAMSKNSTGVNNIAIGNFALDENMVGEHNIAIGTSAGYDSTGNNNIFIGYGSGRYETGSDKLFIDTSNATSPLIYGDFAADELTINGQLKVTEKLIANRSGDADMKAYVYGLVYYNGNIDTNRSTSGFSIYKSGIGTYEVTLSSVYSQNYIVSATAEIGGAGTAVIATTDYSSTTNGKFIIRIYQLSGALLDNSFHFVVYKK